MDAMLLQWEMFFEVHISTFIVLHGEQYELKLEQ